MANNRPEAANLGSASQGPLATQLLQRLESRITDTLSQPYFNLDYFQYVVNQEAFILTSASSILNIPAEIVECLLSLQRMIHAALSQESPCVFIREGGRGRPKFCFSEELLSRLIDMPLPVSCIANLLGVSQSTIFRRMHELRLSTRLTYSSLSDSELDDAVISIKTRIPNAGYRMVKGCLQSNGHRVQWNRIKESMHRVDAPGILERMTQLGCIVRRTYFVQRPLSLVHVDTNHKLIRYNIVIFGAIDGYSRKVHHFFFFYCFYYSALFFLYMFVFMYSLLIDCIWVRPYYYYYYYFFFSFLNPKRIMTKPNSNNCLILVFANSFFRFSIELRH
ncbi:uncharacterized protein LOC128019679 isoform X1 [Carassius gibelio]|uniref:uncharacterized protein LOC128019679 isoform X1 n=1 Tax=Carassius gibelio TaxID=101364 RepID=UPI002279695F|nr:uncharacterized protein LOC128019679 isoform X1 [Carassius gibelio]